MVLQMGRLDPFGVEIDLDLRMPIDTDTQDALRAAIAEHSLLVFHGQALEPDDQTRVMGYFGRVLPRSTGDGYEYVANDPARGDLGHDRISFHSDLAFSPSPWEKISLFAVDVDEGRTSTRFASGAGAYARLRTETRRRLNDRE